MYRIVPMTVLIAMGYDDQAGNSELCLPTPKRVIVLSDSIFDCSSLGETGEVPSGPDDEDCSPKIVASYVDDTYGPVTYENLAVAGARTRDVPEQQLPMMPVGAGHALVLIYVGGNDLGEFMGVGDDETSLRWTNEIKPLIARQWDVMFEFFNNPDNSLTGKPLV
jgi:hypothetical protein